jgi:hypothetical protein
MNQNRSASAAPPPIATEHVMRAGTSLMRTVGDISRFRHGLQIINDTRYRDIGTDETPRVVLRDDN